ncbi:MAG TPA: pilus assembly protein TadG-related protein, partial [Balneolales bacterium]|nr:pilus assembly protein TadG-related protein [Balneolales bacterium]
MNMKRQLISKLKDQKGASAIIIGVALVMLIGFAAIAIDIGYLYSTRNELQNIADASALAGAGLLGDVYAHLTSAEQQTYACGDQNTISDSFENDCDSIINRAQDVVGSSKNLAGGEDIVIDPNEVKIGDWNSASRTFTEFTNLTTLRPNAVKVVARRDTSRVNTSVATFFARIFNVDSVAVSAEATAALTGVSIEDEGKMNLPIGLSWTQFYENCAADPLVKRSGICSDLIEFSP